MNLNLRFDKNILACGGMLKNTFCLAKDGDLFVSEANGDLKDFDHLQEFEKGIDHYKDSLKINPDIIAYDLHPEYLSTKYALGLNGQKIGVQHHHAHIVSCMAENRLNGDVIGVCFDGLGYGEDGKFWGGEFFVANYKEYRRMFHFDYIPMPGGEAAIREPWRMEVAYLYAVFGRDYFERENKEVQLILKLIDSKINSPEISSVGRLFDGVSSMVGIRKKVDFEAQAAIELQNVADKEQIGEYQFDIRDSIIDWRKIIREVEKDKKDGVDTSTISGKFHNTIAKVILEICNILRDDTGINDVVLSGGVFQNALLLEKTNTLLRSLDFNLYTHQKVACNDSGISLGQAVIANARM